MNKLYNNKIYYLPSQIIRKVLTSSGVHFLFMLFMYLLFLPVLALIGGLMVYTYLIPVVFISFYIFFYSHLFHKEYSFMYVKKMLKKYDVPLTGTNQYGIELNERLSFQMNKKYYEMTVNQLDVTNDLFQGITIRNYFNNKELQIMINTYQLSIPKMYENTFEISCKTNTIKHLKQIVFTKEEAKISHESNTEIILFDQSKLNAKQLLHQVYVVYTSILALLVIENETTLTKKHQRFLNHLSKYMDETDTVYDFDFNIQQLITSCDDLIQGSIKKHFEAHQVPVYTNFATMFIQNGYTVSERTPFEFDYMLESNKKNTTSNTKLHTFNISDKLFIHKEIEFQSIFKKTTKRKIKEFIYLYKIDRFLIEFKEEYTFGKNVISKETIALMDLNTNELLFKNNELNLEEQEIKKEAYDVRKSFNDELNRLDIHQYQLN